MKANGKHEHKALEKCSKGQRQGLTVLPLLVGEVHAHTNAVLCALAPSCLTPYTKTSASQTRVS